MIVDKKKIGRKVNNFKYESEEECRYALSEIALFFCFLCVTTIVALSVRHLYMFYFNDAIYQLFLTKQLNTPVNINFDMIVTTEDWWNFMELNFLDHLEHQQKNQSGDVNKQIFLNENLLLGPPRLRQIRVKKDEGCRLHEVFYRYFKSCYPDYSSNLEVTNGNFKGTQFYTLNELDAVSLVGKIHTYNGAGFVKDLTYDLDTNIKIVQELRKNNWIDRATRLIVLEFCLFNSNTDLFNSIKFIAEYAPTGGMSSFSLMHTFKYHSLWSEFDYVVVPAALIFYLMTAYFLYKEIEEIRRIGIYKYLQSVWNIVDLLIILLAVFSFFYNIWHSWYMSDILKNAQDNPNEHQSLDIACKYNKFYVDMMAICIFLVWIKIFKYISFNKTLMQFCTTLKRCAPDLLGFGVMFGIVFLAYAQLGLLLFGSKHKDFRNFKESVLTMMRMVLGDFEYHAIEEANRLLGPIYFLSYILLVFFILLNMFLAIINDTYSVVKAEVRGGSNLLQKYIARKVHETIQRIYHPRGFKDFHEEKGSNLKSSLEVSPAKPPEIPSDSSTMYPFSSMTTLHTSNPEEQLEKRRSEILREFFEEVDLQAEPQAPPYGRRQSESVERLSTRLALMEDLMEQLISDMDVILKRVENTQRRKLV